MTEPLKLTEKQLRMIENALSCQIHIANEAKLPVQHLMDLRTMIMDHYWGLVDTLYDDKERKNLSIVWRLEHARYIEPEVN